MPMIEVPGSSPSATASMPRSLVDALRRGASKLCPACGRGSLYGRYLKVVDRCGVCGEELYHHRADDAPPYFTILIVGHVIVGGVLLLEDLVAPATWVHALVWGPLILLMSLWLLPRIKGALVGLQWALRMHGFGERSDVEEAPDGSLR